MSTPDRVKTRVLIISDTHLASLRPRDDQPQRPTPPFEAPLPAADVLIHCGDLTYTGDFKQFEQTLDMLKDIEAPVCSIDFGPR
jgi:predicted phosphodiesterase